MAFASPPQTLPTSPKRAALYLRVSTGKQATNDVSIPSQKDLTSRYCEAHGWVVTEEFVEPGASATDDRRPVFQKMLEQAHDPERRFDVICVHAFSRFYRNGAEMELTIRRLRKLGVEVISATQPTGTDPSQELMRQIIGIFDEYTSRENGKNVIRSMRESAKQGFWNGSRQPTGYQIVEAERRGTKIKKKLEIDHVEAELIRLIFRLYDEGDGTSGPLGIKEVTKWLNRNGYHTRSGSAFGIGTVHGILRNSCYATGKWPYGVRNARTGQLNDPSMVVEISIPTIIPLDLFDRVALRLSNNNPRITPPRVINGPTLLIGLTVCASCGSGMTRTGTQRRGRSYSYYSCAGCQQRGKTFCKGRHMPMGKLDELVVSNLKERLLTPERLEHILEALIERESVRDAATSDRRNSIDTEIAAKDEKIARLYRAIEDGVIELDGQLKDRISTLKAERAIAKAALDRLSVQTQARAAITPERLAAFAAMMRERLDSADIKARKAYLQTVVTKIEVDDGKIRIYGDKAALAKAVTGHAPGAENVRGLVRKWRADHEKGVNLYLLEIHT